MTQTNSPVTVGTARLTDDIDPVVARDVMVGSYAELAARARQLAAEEGQPVPAEATVLASQAMRRLMGPTWEQPTRADLMVVKKRLDAKLGFDHAPPEVRDQHDETCLYVVERLR